MQMTQEETATKLSDLLRGELSAVETYSQAIDKMHQANLISILQEAHNCHAARANIITGKMRELGIEPPMSSGVWGAFARLMENSAQLFGDRATIAVLEEGEDHGLGLYKAHYADNDPVVKKLVREFLPKQEGTHRIMQDLKISLA
ncbi:MAG: DUF2383 domain-containing protein [Cyanobacteria bacterium SZAS LIN-3]|nr:DUF2383 domain-containing protein [Cyanobacteria bacterium SZAS LIN-3]